MQASNSFIHDSLYLSKPFLLSPCPDQYIGWVGILPNVPGQKSFKEKAANIHSSFLKIFPCSYIHILIDSSYPYMIMAC